MPISLDVAVSEDASSITCIFSPMHVRSSDASACVNATPWRLTVDAGGWRGGGARAQITWSGGREVEPYGMRLTTNTALRTLTVILPKMVLSAWAGPTPVVLAAHDARVVSRELDAREAAWREERFEAERAEGAAAAAAAAALSLQGGLAAAEAARARLEEAERRVQEAAAVKVLGSCIVESSTTSTEVLPLPAPRAAADLASVTYVNFTARALPTPLRASKLAAERAWERQQTAEAVMATRRNLTAGAQRRAAYFRGLAYAEVGDHASAAAAFDTATSFKSHSSSEGAEDDPPAAELVGRLALSRYLSKATAEQTTQAAAAWAAADAAAAPAAAALRLAATLREAATKCALVKGDDRGDGGGNGKGGVSSDGSEVVLLDAIAAAECELISLIASSSPVTLLAHVLSLLIAVGKGASIEALQIAASSGVGSACGPLAERAPRGLVSLPSDGVAPSLADILDICLDDMIRMAAHWKAALGDPSGSV